jgi:glycerol-3-phosphate acyltransferase PlsY
VSWELGLVAAAYLLGSIPSALLVVWMFSGKDVRHEGSGNVGAANATRVAGWAAGAVVTVMDVAKGAVPVWLMSVLNPESWWLAATMLAAVLGHCYPVWLRFRGGKGVATAFGAFLVLAPVPTLIALGVWVVVLAVSQRVSPASLAASAVFPVLLALLDDPGPVMLGAVSAVAVLIIARHHSNIRQLIDGTEPTIGGGDG